MYGVTSDGFVRKPQADIESDIDAALRAAFGASINTSAKSVFGQLKAILSERMAELWEVAEAVAGSLDPDSASGAALEAVAALTGTTRQAAVKSTVTITAMGTPGTILSSGRVVSVLGTGVRFTTTAGGTIAAVGAWANTTAYTLGTQRSNGGNVYEVITAGTSAGSGGPTGTGTDITDDTVHWKYLGTGTGAVAIAAEAVDTGPKVANAGTLTVIETPVAGWSSVTNRLDADLGNDEETDAALRLRREEEIRAQGNAALEAIKGHVLKVEGVTKASAFMNTTMTTDGDGLPAKSVEVVVTGGDDDDIREAIFEAVAAGIETYGTESGTVTDSESQLHTIKFSRPNDVDVWIIVNVTVNPDYFPSDGADQIEAALVEEGDTNFVAGRDVVASALVPIVFDIPGVLDVSSILIGLSNPPVASTTLVMTLRDVAVFDTGRITVNVTNGTP